MPMKVFPVRWPDSDWEEIERLAKIEGKTQSDIIREYFRRGVDQAALCSFISDRISQAEKALSGRIALAEASIKQHVELE